MSHIDVGLGLHLVAGIASIIVLAYTIKMNGIFRGLPLLQKPWYIMILAVVLVIAHAFGMVIRMYLHLPATHPIALETGVTLMGFVVALAYSLISMVRAWTPQGGKG